MQSVKSIANSLPSGLPHSEIKWKFDIFYFQQYIYKIMFGVGGHKSTSKLPSNLRDQIFNICICHP